MQDLVSQLAMMLSGGMPPQMSPTPEPMSPVPPGFFAPPVRPAGLPGVPQPNFSPVPPGALGPQRLGPAEAPPPQAAPMPQPDLNVRPQVPASMLDSFAEMLSSGDDSALPSGEAQGGFGGFLRDAAMGMASGNPTAPPAMSFGRGFAGSMASNEARNERAAKARREAEEFGWKREDRPFERGLKMTEEQRKQTEAARAERKAKLEEAKTAMELMSPEAKTEIGKLRADLRSGRISHEDFDAAMSKHMPQTIERIRSKLSGMATGQNAEDVLNPGELKVYNDWLSQKQPWYMQDEPSMPEDGGGAAPAAPSPAPAPAPVVPPEAAPPAPGRKPAPAGPSGEVPMALGPGADGLEVLTPEQAQQKPKGTRFRTIDGRIGTVR